jgi:hypothetical protein
MRGTTRRLTSLAFATVSLACVALVAVVYGGISWAAHSPQAPTPNNEQLVRSVGALYNYLWVNDSAALDHDFPSLLGCQQLGKWLACHTGITYLGGCTRMYTVRLGRDNVPYPQMRRSIRHCGPRP